MKRETTTVSINRLTSFATGAKITPDVEMGTLVDDSATSRRGRVVKMDGEKVMVKWELRKWQKS